MVTGLTHIFDIEGSIFIAVLSMPGRYSTVQYQSTM